MDMSRGGHSTRRKNRSAFGGPFSIGVVLVSFLATIPLGSVGFLAMQGVVAMAWISGTIGVLAGGGRDPLAAPANTKRWVGFLGLFLGWCGFQLLPLPTSWAGLFWGGDAELLRQISVEATGWTIALDRFVSLHTLLLWTGLGVLAWGCSRQIQGRSSRSLLLFGLVGLGVFQSILGIFFLKTATGRMYGTFGSPDALGGLLAMTLPVTLGLWFTRVRWHERRGSSILNRLGYDWKVWRNGMFVAALGIQGTALYFTGSRGAAVATLVASAILMTWLGKERSEFRSRILGAGVVLVVLMVLFGVQGRRDNLMERTFGESGEFQQAKASRVEIWKSAVRLCQMFPWGTGPGGTALVLPMFQTGAYGRYRLDYAHNDSLQFLGDLGIVGFGALACGLGLILWRGARGCRKNEETHGESVWLMRGAWVAVLAALCHAQVDFNLSGRPGIQVAFVLLCGILWGADSRLGESVDQPTERARRKGWRSLVLVPICILAVCFSLRAAWAWRLHEGAAAALGLALDEHFWFERPQVRPEEAILVLEKATEWAPGFSKIHSTAAEAQLVWQDQRIQQAARSIVAASEEDVSTEWSMDALLPAQEAAIRLAGLALRVEEKEMVQTALKEANAAVRLAPWDAMARLIRSKVWFRGYSRKIFDVEVSTLARNELELVTSLYPRDAGVLADACLALSLGERNAKNMDDLLNWGRRALEIDSTLALTVLRAWRMARIPVSRMLDIPQLPFSFLWSLYAGLQKQHLDEEAGACLLALENCLEKEQPPESSTLWTTALWKHWNIQQAQYRLQIATERIKRCLRTGDWEGLRALPETRATVRRDRFQIEWDRMGLSETSSAVLRRLRLREWDTKYGLLPEWLLECRLLELEAGMSAKWMQEPLAEVILMDGISSENLKRLAECRRTMGEATFLEYVMDAKTAESTGKTAEALRLLDFLQNREMIPPRFFHRMWLWRANLLEQDGQMNAAREAVQKAALACPSDPDVVEAMERLGGAPLNEWKDVVPTLDIGFKGERLLLKQVYLERKQEEGEGLQLHLVWRLRGGLPPDLKMEVRIRGPEGQLFMRKNTRVDQEVSANFNRGNPIPGALWTWTVPVPPKAEDGQRVEMLLLSEDKLLTSDEGLSVLELYLKKLPYIR